MLYSFALCIFSLLPQCISTLSLVWCSLCGFQLVNCRQNKRLCDNDDDLLFDKHMRFLLFVVVLLEMIEHVFTGPLATESKLVPLLYNRSSLSVLAKIYDSPFLQKNRQFSLSLVCAFRKYQNLFHMKFNGTIVALPERTHIHSFEHIHHIFVRVPTSQVCS